MSTAIHEPRNPGTTLGSSLTPYTAEHSIGGLRAADRIHSINIKQLEIRGFIKSATGVANFLNVPFARIPGRFREAKQIDPRNEIGIIDASKYGGICPQNVDVPHQTTSHLYPRILSEVDNSAEYTCLNLNIYTPPDIVSSGKKLPVVAWIHGGAFQYGANTEEYDGNYFVQHSIDIGKPVILVALNYRVGYYGFLSSQELRDEAIRLGESGFANLGLHDQRIGLQWIQRNIQFFGGDGFEITCAGESAGACSILFHLRSDFPVFQRAFALSPANVTPVDHTIAQATFDQLVSKAGILQSTPAREKLDKLRNLTPAEFNNLTPPGVTSPIWDEKWFVDQACDSAFAGSQPFPSWIRGIVIGSAMEEMALFGQHWGNWTGAQTVAALKKDLADDRVAEQILAAYGFRDDDIPGSSIDSLVRLTSDQLFRTVARDVAASRDEVPVSLYSFEQKDTFPQSLYKGRAYHSLGNSMFFRQPTVAGPHVADAGMISTANKMCEAAIALAYGEQWEAYASTKKVMVFDGEKTGLRQAAEKEPWDILSLTQEEQMCLKNAITTLMQVW